MIPHLVAKMFLPCINVSSFLHFPTREILSFISFVAILSTTKFKLF